MINNVISVPVHEKAEVVIDQIVNYNFFCPECGIVLHISNGFNWKDSLLKEEDFLSILSTFENVFVNPTRLNTAYADIVHTHISNFEYISKVVEFEYFSLGSSNDLFVRHMPEISDGESCSSLGSTLERVSSYLSFYKKIIADEYLNKILEHFGVTQSYVRKGQIEGSFYSKDIFQKIVDIINKVYSYEEVWNKNRLIYPREEVYYNTIANILNKDKSLKITQPNFTRIFWEMKGILPTIQQITEIAEGKIAKKYAVKRVLRNIDDPARVYIGTQIGNYREQTLNLIHSKTKENEHD